jgi:hypothetical protein
LFSIYVDGIIGADELFLLLENFFENDTDDIFERFKNFTLS